MREQTRIEHWPLKTPFAIARETIETLDLVHLTIEFDGVTACAEAAGVDYRGETPETIALQIETYLRNRDTPPARNLLREEMPAGGARNAIDCALWAWEARRLGKSVLDFVGLANARPLTTAFTIGLASPENMARGVCDAPLGAPLKLKLGGQDDRDLNRVSAVRAAAPDRALLVDVNEGWSFDELVSLAPMLRTLGVQVIEQPLPRGEDDALASYQSPVPIFADESFDDVEDFDHLSGYSGINIKLDKCGGLTSALAIVAEARSRNFGLMVGSMLGTSLGMAPAFIIGQSCDLVDLDGPLLLARDRDPAISYEGSLVHVPPTSVWG